MNQHTEDLIVKYLTVYVRRYTDEVMNRFKVNELVMANLLYRVSKNIYEIANKYEVDYKKGIVVFNKQTKGEETHEKESDK